MPKLTNRDKSTRCETASYILGTVSDACRPLLLNVEKEWLKDTQDDMYYGVSNDTTLEETETGMQRFVEDMEHEGVGHLVMCACLSAYAFAQKVDYASQRAALARLATYTREAINAAATERVVNAARYESDWIAANASRCEE